MRYPLDRALSSEAQVRLLRVLLTEVEEPVAVPDASRLAGLTAQGARQALNRLADVGLVRRIGTGRSMRFGISDHHPLCRSLAVLFSTERERFDELVSGLRGALTGMAEVAEAWVQRFPMSPEEPMEIVVVCDASAVGWIGEEVRTCIMPVEKQLDLIIDVLVRTRADRSEPGREAILLTTLGGTDRTGLPRSGDRHQDADQRSLRLAQGIADFVRTDPALLTRAKHHLDRLVRDGGGTATGDITEWRQVLQTYSTDRICDLLVSRSSRGQRLRQSAPFFAVLTPEQRDQLVASLEQR